MSSALIREVERSSRQVIPPVKKALSAIGPEPWPTNEVAASERRA